MGIFFLLTFGTKIILQVHDSGQKYNEESHEHQNPVVGTFAWLDKELMKVEREKQRLDREKSKIEEREARYDSDYNSM